MTARETLSPCRTARATPRQRATTASVKRLTSNDPNQGLWNFAYDGLGQLVQQQDGRGAYITITSRDALGRVLAQTSEPWRGAALPPSSGIMAEATRDTWVFDTPLSGAPANSAAIGAPSQVTRQRGADLNSLGQVWSETYTYDGNTKRLKQRKVTQELEAVPLTTSYQYDSYYGREKAITYPGFSNGTFSVWKQYNAYGELSSILDTNTLTPAWTKLAEDQFGHTTGEQFGYAIKSSHVYSASTGQAETMNWMTMSGTSIDGMTYAYDSLGNLKSQVRLGGGSESYNYDSLQRLKDATRGGMPSVLYEYDSIGNLTKKSDYSANSANAYQYANASKPNQVTSVTKPVGSDSYTYDGNGNVINGAVSEMYDANNQARQITRGGSITVNFFYGATGARYREEGSSTTIFGADGFERTGTGSTTTYRYELGPVRIHRRQQPDHDYVHAARSAGIGAERGRYQWRSQYHKAAHVRCVWQGARRKLPGHGRRVGPAACDAARLHGAGASG